MPFGSFLLSLTAAFWSKVMFTTIYIVVLKPLIQTALSPPHHPSELELLTLLKNVHDPQWSNCLDIYSSNYLYLKVLRVKGFKC